MAADPTKIVFEVKDPLMNISIEISRDGQCFIAPLEPSNDDWGTLQAQTREHMWGLVSAIMGHLSPAITESRG